tara:strand:+ start:765 stop:926 length:162 start_codon:yes stop_codon:yes gene_type:complete
MGRSEKNEILQLIEKIIGERGFEPPTPCSQGRYANQAALLPEFKLFITCIVDF